MLYNGRHAKSEKVGCCWVSSRLGWLLELLTELIMVKYCVCQIYTRAQVLDVYDMELRPNLHALVGTELWLKECKTKFANRCYLSVTSGIDFVFYKQGGEKVMANT